ncbi:hypothetical protein D3C76_939480 [compost metagenome]
MVEQHLEQRAVAEAALRLQGFDQLLERQVLVRLGLQRRVLDPLQQGTERLARIELAAVYLGIDEKADQAFGFSAIAVGHRHPDADIALAAVAVQQHFERGQQQHERRHPATPGQGRERLGQCRWQSHLKPRTTRAAQARAWVISGQFQQCLVTLQLLEPVAQLPRLLPRLHPRPLPQGVVGVLDRQRRKRHLAPFAASGVQLHQLIDHDLHRPAIGDDVMQGQGQHVVVGCQTQQLEPQQWPLAQVERAQALALDKCLDQRRLIACR